MITLGIKRLCKSPLPSLKGRRLGLLCNQASTDDNFVHTRDLVSNIYPGQLACLFSPQHGFFSEKQDNMIESDHSTDQQADIPVFSLYGEMRRPDPAMFDLIDILIIDLVDVGTRVYTFMSTMAYCIEEAGRQGKKILVLDRPNPIGGDAVEGNILRENCFSFVGMYPIPMRHGMTFGELALFINDLVETPADLEVLTMKGWQRSMLFTQTGLNWVYPSPNIPTLLSALVYPGQVIWEGTNISEGRGTTLPFELCGAPFVDSMEVLEKITSIPLPGCVLRPVGFEPTSNKWQGEVCKGFHIHVTDYNQFLPYRTSLALLQAIALLYPDNFLTKTTPYEYEYERCPLDLIIGDDQIRKLLLSGIHLLELEKNWQHDLLDFCETRKKYLLY